MKRPSWWILALLGVFFAYFAILVYCDIRRPQEIGFEADFVAERMTTRRVTPGSPADLAGLRPGDVVVAADAKQIRSIRDLEVIDGHVTFDRPTRFTVLRGGQSIDVDVTLGPVAWSYWKTEPGIVLLVVLSVQLISLVLAAVVVLKRPDDTGALIGAWALATMGVFKIVLPYRYAAVWRAALPGIGVVLCIPHLSGSAASAVLFTFFASFPRRMTGSKRAWLALWTPMLVALVRPAKYAIESVYAPQRASAAPIDRQLLTAVTIAYIVAGLIALVVNYRRLDRNERRRVKVVVIGAITGLAPGVILVASYWLQSSANYSQSIFASRITSVGTLGLLLLPGSLAYAILRYRLFDISVLIRQGVRYALARRVLASLVPALAVLLTADILLHGDRPLSEVLKSRGWMYAAVAGLAVVAHVNRQRWLSGLDRRFFREHYNAQQILRFVAEDIRRVGDFERVAPRVVAQIEAALHPEFVVLLVREPNEVVYRALVAMPPGGTAPTLRVDSTLVALLRLLAKPVEVGSGQIEWLQQQLPAQDIDLLRDSRIDLLVPVVTGPSRSESILALGIKRSEEPYTRQDVDLLSVIASNLALLLERPASAPESPAPTFDECPDCGACYEAGTARCAVDGAALTPIPLSRVLAARYQLDRRLGHGGLGTVYAATDTALDRQVAIKVIRHDLVTNDDVARRFQREARIAAAFVHPNVVTVHDFGVTSAGRAFLVMELLSGATLRDELKRRRRLSPAETLHVLAGVCAAVEAAHRRQLVHRDLKPENIFLARSETGQIAKVLDFGIAKVLAAESGPATQHSTVADVLVGTLPYMSPELLRGEEVQPVSDLWALGVVAYEMLTGDHPFAAHETVSAGANLGSSLPSLGAATFFTTALALDPTKRPQSAAQFLTQLQRALGAL